MRQCSVDDCDRTRVTASGLCNMHRMRLRQNGAVGEPTQRWNLVVDGHKYCKMCERTLSVESFGRKPNDVVHTYCSECYPVYIKYRNILIKFKLTKMEYDDLTANGCSVCGDNFRLSVDHDHSCCSGIKSCGNCIRGVLCMRHNLLLGNAQDSISELETMITYLKDFEK